MEDNPPTPPTDCGQRLIPKLVDEIAQSDPQRPYLSIPRSSVLEEGYEDISFIKFATAVNGCAWRLSSRLGHEASCTLLYIGPLDVRYLVVILAAAKTGHVVSCSNSTEFLGTG